MEKYTNELIHESSPYLLQHAHNPVNWLPWSEQVFEKAKAENKLILISVGYSSCHWCHVMEHESFEDEKVAELMNKYFVCVKVDREERPDVDQVYMTAVQLMTQRGGWPLNCFTLPDGRPVYGGTYFPKDQWMYILQSLEDTYRKDPVRAEEYAAQLQEGISQSELISRPAEVDKLEEERLHELVLRWSRNFDSREGGDSRAPKFPLPNNYQFLLQYASENEHAKVLNHVELTLDKMAMGGIYDQVGGGFARYSVDVLWKVPHFEKMLYDNGQLVELYSEAFSRFQKPLYKRIVYQTIAWLEREMTGKEGAFYSALDADSEGEEGKFYCWSAEEFRSVTGADAEWASEFYNINQRGYWEDHKYILLRTASDRDFAKQMHWTSDVLETEIAKINQKLLDERSHRIRPGLDDKCLTSWNAIMLKGLCRAFAVFEEDHFLHLALKNARWIRDVQLKKDGSLFRSYKNGKSSIDGFLEDYAHVIDAFIAVYEITQDENWLSEALKLTNYTIEHFFDPTSGMFFFTRENSGLIARKMDINDNVMPAANSVMAKNLFFLGQLFYNKDFQEKSLQMLRNVYDGMENYGSGYSNWAQLLMMHVYPFYTLVVKGEKYKEKTRELLMNYLPNCIVAGGESVELPVLNDKVTPDGETRIYVCYDGTCLLPTTEIADVLKEVVNG